MPVPRDPDLPQINAGQALYGAIPIELLPDGTTLGQLAYWDGVQWHIATLVAGVGIDLEFDADTEQLTFVNADHRFVESMTADAVFLKIAAVSFTADAVLV